MKLFLYLVVPLFVIAGCDSRYRYPCQNPENWDEAACQKPLCEVNRDCPEHIFKPNDSRPSPLAPAAPGPRKGECR